FFSERLFFFVGWNLLRQCEDRPALSYRAVVVIVKGTSMESFQHGVGLSVFIAQLAENLSDEQGPQVFRAVGQLQRDTQSLLFHADAVDTVGTSLGHQVGIV